MTFDVVGLTTLIACIALALHTMLLRRKLEKYHAISQQQQQQLAQEMQGVSNGSVGVGRRLLELEHEYRELITRLDTLEHDDPSRVAYSEASRLVNLGAEIEDLISSCGISRPEAELVSAVHRRNKQAPVLN